MRHIVVHSLGELIALTFKLGNIRTEVFISPELNTEMKDWVISEFEEPSIYLLRIRDLLRSGALVFNTRKEIVK